MEEYHIYFQWLLDYLEQDLSREEMTLEVFLEWTDFLRKRASTDNGKYSHKDNESFSPAF
jgi:hypothetical protein